MKLLVPPSSERLLYVKTETINSLLNLKQCNGFKSSSLSCDQPLTICALKNTTILLGTTTAEPRLATTLKHTSEDMIWQTLEYQQLCNCSNSVRGIFHTW